MIEVTSSIKIDKREVHFDFIRATGPGGQNVNKVASSVQLRFDVRNSPALEQEIKERLIKLAGSRVTEDGILLIEAKRFRSQEQNRIDAIQRLVGLIQNALEPPRPRRATRPSLAARRTRLEDKKRRSEIKRSRNRMAEEK